MDLNKLEKTIGYSFVDQSLLEKALTHTSYRYDVKFSYERLEFLGDRVLGMCVSSMLFKKFKKETEGDLSQRLTSLVCRDTVAFVAKELTLDKHVLLSQSEDATGGRENKAILCDVCEALIGAIYLDSNFEKAYEFIEKNWQELLSKNIEPPKDAKTALQEWSQSKKLGIPTYIVENEEGENHEPLFTISVNIEGYDKVTAQGKNKKTAQRLAAEEFLKGIKDEN